MRSVSVTEPDGTRWTVRVVWEPRWRALARRFGGWRLKRRSRGRGADGALDGTGPWADAALSGTGRGGAGSSDLGDVLVVVMVVLAAVVAAAAVFWWVLLPLLLVVIDVVVVLALLCAALVGRVLFRRPWTVEARAEEGARAAVEVVGWRAALRRRDEVADLLRLGQRPGGAGVHVP